MALLFVDGFDAGDIAAKWSVSSGSWSYSASTRFSTGGAASVSGLGTTLKSFTASAQVFVGMALFVSNLSNRILFTFRGDAGVTAHTRLMVSTDGILYLQRGGTTVATSAAGALNQSVWTYIELSTTIADAGGTVTVKSNGTTVINFTGDTRNGGASTNLDSIFIGESTSISYDDLYICNSVGSAPYNTFLGDIRIHSLMPNGAGSLTQMTPSSGANYTTVDELPYSATDYVRGSAGQVDLYTAADLPAGVGTIFGVQANAIVKKSDAGNLSGRTVIKSGTTTSNGTSISLGTTDTTITDTRSLNPDTSLAWTSGDVNGIEVGMEAV
jgi:hypothetical protein